jgi:Antitoxin Xre-like helix-turn-helix domain/Antitoxin Xre/MbcA/ParS C-terminal toxin-binding domain
MARMASLRTELPALAPIEPQTFAREADRERLSEVAIKAFLALAKAWGLSNGESAGLLGVSPSSFDRIKRGYRPSLSQDQLTRVSALVGIFKGLHLLFADSTADEWIRRANRGALFDRRTPIEAMIEGGIPRMLEVRQYIDAARGGL